MDSKHLHQPGLVYELLIVAVHKIQQPFDTKLLKQRYLHVEPQGRVAATQHISCRRLFARALGASDDRWSCQRVFHVGFDDMLVGERARIDVLDCDLFHVSVYRVDVNQHVWPAYKLGFVDVCISAHLESLVECEGHGVNPLVAVGVQLFLHVCEQLDCTPPVRLAASRLIAVREYRFLAVPLVRVIALEHQSRILDQQAVLVVLPVV